MVQSGAGASGATFRLLRHFATVHPVAEEGAKPGQPPRPVDPRALRVSDAEREHVAGLLNKALARGLIDLDGFAERLGAALAAKTRAELNTVVIDLPGLVVRNAPNGRGD
ncbi:hypothetical protein DMH04_48610 [Kibdelosporangium aridum]|uniref:DUF1707 domain-containing protein n=1 Tax=Kibdelosporangium aridum TaxID=2030 RepID=A0A428YJ04_KIBAR|nr:hypothetical protein DMH04_48610 [Kibdelosporangium aridum]